MPRGSLKTVVGGALSRHDVADTVARHEARYAAPGSASDVEGAAPAASLARLAPKGTVATSDLLNRAADGLIAGGERRIFTPLFFFFVARKADGASA